MRFPDPRQSSEVTPTSTTSPISPSIDPRDIPQPRKKDDFYSSDDSLGSYESPPPRKGAPQRGTPQQAGGAQDRYWGKGKDGQKGKAYSKSERSGPQELEMGPAQPRRTDPRAKEDMFRGTGVPRFAPDQYDEFTPSSAGKGGKKGGPPSSRADSSSQSSGVRAPRPEIDGKGNVIRREESGYDPRTGEYVPAREHAHPPHGQRSPSPAQSQQHSYPKGPVSGPVLRKGSDDSQSSFDEFEDRHMKGDPSKGDHMKGFGHGKGGRKPDYISSESSFEDRHMKGDPRDHMKGGDHFKGAGHGKGGGKPDYISSESSFEYPSKGGKGGQGRHGGKADYVSRSGSFEHVKGGGHDFKGGKDRMSPQGSFERGKGDGKPDYIDSESSSEHFKGAKQSFKSGKPPSSHGFGKDGKEHRKGGGKDSSPEHRGKGGKDDQDDMFYDDLTGQFVSSRDNSFGSAKPGKRGRQYDASPSKGDSMKGAAPGRAGMATAALAHGSSGSDGTITAPSKGRGKRDPMMGSESEDTIISGGSIGKPSSDRTMMQKGGKGFGKEAERRRVEFDDGRGKDGGKEKGGKHPDYQPRSEFSTSSYDGMSPAFKGSDAKGSSKGKMQKGRSFDEYSSYEGASPLAKGSPKGKQHKGRPEYEKGKSDRYDDDYSGRNFSQDESSPPSLMAYPQGKGSSPLGKGSLHAKGQSMQYKGSEKGFAKESPREYSPMSFGRYSPKGGKGSPAPHARDSVGEEFMSQMPGWVAPAGAAAKGAQRGGLRRILSIC